MLTTYGRVRKYKDGVEFRWDVELKEIVITVATTDDEEVYIILPKKKIPTLQRFLLSVQHRPETKLKEKKK